MLEFNLRRQVPVLMLIGTINNGPVLGKAFCWECGASVCLPTLFFAVLSLLRREHNKTTHAPVRLQGLHRTKSITVDKAVLK